MRTRIAALGMTIALIGLLAPTASATKEATATGEAFLFTVDAASGSTAKLKKTGNGETFTLTLTGVDSVTQFSDRPFRDSKIISPGALDANWDAWFGNDPPNAVLTFARSGKSPGSMVVTLTNPRYRASDRTLTFTATRDRRQHDPAETGAGWQRATTPKRLTSASLFIDSYTGTGTFGTHHLD